MAPSRPKKHRVLLLTSPIGAAARRQLLKDLRKRLKGVTLSCLATPAVGGETDIRLSPRLKQVLLGLAMGQSVKEIATQLRLSQKTIETHRQILVDRLGIRRLPELVRYALRSGVLPATWLRDGRGNPRPPRGS